MSVEEPDMGLSKRRCLSTKGNLSTGNVTALSKVYPENVKAIHEIVQNLLVANNSLKLAHITVSNFLVFLVF